VQWYQTFGGGDYDQGRSVQQTTEGGYIVCGITMSYGAGSEDVWLIKTDADGNKLWDKTFGGKEIDVGVSAQQTTDGGYIVCGSTFSYRGDSEDIWLIKTDADGNKLWDKAFGGEGTHAGRSVQQTVDGGYIVCGITKSSGADNAGVRMKNTNARLIKTDAEGNKLWDKAFSSGQGEIAATSVKQTTDGGYILCGESGSYESLKANVWLMKTDAEGNKLWDKTFGGEELAFADSVRQTTDGGYILCGVAGSYQTGKTKVWLIKTDLEGNKLWDKKFGGGGIAMGESIQQTTDGGYIMCGQTTSYQTGKTQALLIKVDANGNELWDKTFEGELAAEGYSVQQMADGGYIVCGTTKSLGSEGSKVLLYKIAPEQ
jgi:transcription elongation factor Elf1